MSGISRMSPVTFGLSGLLNLRAVTFTLANVLCLVPALFCPVLSILAWSLVVDYKNNITNLADVVNQVLGERRQDTPVFIFPQSNLMQLPT